MQQLIINEQEHFFVNNVKELQKINRQLARLSLQKEEITQEIIGALGHQHEGQKTYEYDVWKIEVKTPCVYSLNKSLYESGKIKLPNAFNPIKESVSYSIDKRLCEKFIESAPGEIRDALVELIEKKPGKASIVVKENI